MEAVNLFLFPKRIPKKQDPKEHRIMKELVKQDLYDRLCAYSRSDYYPFHMPGHKRDSSWLSACVPQDPYRIDITEIDGFDNLHHAEGILKEAMEETASFYGAEASYFLVNGSTCGILSAISACCDPGDTILMARNCHKAAWHAAFLRNLKTIFVYPQYEPDFGIFGGLSPESVQDLLTDHSHIRACFVVSPTYDGVVSDIRRIASVCHAHHIPLIVDEAHGAHFCYHESFPASALDCGADLVIQSVHKTLPCFTQSALLHVGKASPYVDRQKLAHYLDIYQTSSPSYLLMAGIEEGIRYMAGAKEDLDRYLKALRSCRQALGDLPHIRLFGPERIGHIAIYDYDITKLLLSAAAPDPDSPDSRKASGPLRISGHRLSEVLRREHHLEMEMSSLTCVTAITSVRDRAEGFLRLQKAMEAIDRQIDQGILTPDSSCPVLPADLCALRAEPVCGLAEAWMKESRQLPLSGSAGQVSAEFVYLYPPGIPLLIPGERIDGDLLRLLQECRTSGFSLQGMADPAGQTIRVL